MAPIATMTVKLSAQIAEFQSEFRNATKSAEKFASDFEGIATRASAVGSFIGNVASRIASSLASAFGQGLKDAIRLSSEFANAFTGLTSVARAFGADADAAKDAAKRLSSDGLLPLKDSAAGLKNLLATGFNLDQSVKLMNAFKDSAAFGRQGALSFGDAIRSATEGVKNGNSILVDNAGITKNLSQILKEAGFSAQDLSKASSDAGVRMALFNGILKESAAFTGDAARLTQTYSGQVAKLETAYNGLLGTLGTAITQNATVAKLIGAVSDSILNLNQNLSNNRNAFNLVSDGVIFLVRAVAEMLNVFDLVQTGFAGLQIASNRLFEAFSNIGIAIFKMVEKAESLQKFLDPVKFRQHAAAADEARQAYTFLEGAAQGLRDASRDAQARSESFGNALQEIRARATALANDLETTRGKTVELGTASNVTGSALANGLSNGAQTAAAAAKELREAMKALNKDVGFVEERLQNIGEDFERELGPALKSLAQDMAFVEERLADSFTGQSEELAEFMKFLKGEIDSVEDRIRNIQTVPPTRWEQTFGGLVPAARTAINAVVRVFEQGFSSLADLGKKTAKELAIEFTEELVAKIPFVGDDLAKLVRPVFDFVGGLFDRNKGRDSVKDFASSFGGFDALHKRLSALGTEGERLWIKLTQGVGRNNPEQAAAAINDITKALDAFGTEAERAQKRLDALGSAVAGVNKKAALFASPFQALLGSKNDANANLDSIAAKMAETAQRGQAEFERLGTFVGATFAGLVKESGDAIGAIKSLEPAFHVLRDGVDKFGLSTSGTIDQLLGMFALVNDAVTGPILESIQATGQIFSGLQSAGILTSDLFQTVATDIGASFRELEAKGGDVAKAMALSQPVLQKLWEAQQIYGEITDETTRKILQQAEEQGLVGANMKDVNQKILDVLIAIADVFGAKLPDAFRKTTDAAKGSASGISDAFSQIKVPDIRIKVGFDVDELSLPNGGKVPAMASGGVVRRPTLALIGEAGPEAVVPLSKLSSMSGPSSSGGKMDVTFEVDGRVLAKKSVPYIPGAAKRYVGR